MLGSTALRTAAMIGRRRVVGSAFSQLQQTRTVINLPKGVTSALGGDSDNLIPIDKDRKSKPGHIPDYAPEGLKKDMEELGIDGVESLDELEEKNLEFFNESGFVPPDGSGTFASPILIPSRMKNRVCGYIDPITHATFWFTIENDNATYYVKDLGLFFKMLPIPDEEAAGHH